MAKEIDQLDYKVILDDKEFDARIKADLKLAQDFNTQMSQLLDIKKKVSKADVENAKNAERITREQQKTQQQQAQAEEKLRREQQKTIDQALKGQEQLRREQNKTATQSAINAEKEQKAKLQTAAAQERLNRAQQQGTSAYGGQGRLLRELAGYGAAYFSVRTVERFISSLVRVSGEFELQHRTLQAIIGDVDKADQIFNQLQVLAVKSPFSFSDLTSYAKQLSAFSIPVDELYDTTKMLADVSAGLGVDMGRIILAYGQIRSAAFLRGQEVRQLTESGIPILNELAKQFEEIEGRMVSAGEVFDKISMREVPFEMVEKVFKDMTSEGGKFYNMQEIQAETLKAKVKNLGDQYDIMLYQIGQAQDGILKGSVNAIGNLMEHWQAIARIIVTVASGFGAYAAVLAAVWAREKAIIALDTIRFIVRATQETGSLTKGVKAYRDMMVQAGATTKAAFAASIVGLIAAVTVAIIQAVRAAGELDRELKKINNESFSRMTETLDGFDALVNKLEHATEGSHDYRDAIHQLNSKYGEYLPNLLNEKNAYEEIAASADKARESINRKFYENARTKGLDKIQEKYGDNYANAVTKFEESLSSWGFTFDGAALTAAQARAFAEYFAKHSIGTDDNGNAMFRGVEAIANEYFGAGRYSYNKPYNGPYSYGSYNDDSIGAMALRVYDAATAYNKAVKSMDNRLDVLFNTSNVASEEERAGLEDIRVRYENRVAYLNTLGKTVDEYNAALRQIENFKLRETAQLYERLGQPEKARKYNSALTSNSAQATGNLRLIRDVLASNGINSKSDKHYGLWVDDNANIDEYLDDLAKRYKDVGTKISREEAAFLKMVGTAFSKTDYTKLNDEQKAKYEVLQGLYRQQKIISDIGNVFAIDVTGNTTKTGDRNPQDEYNERMVKSLEQRRQHIEAIRKYYNAFKPFMNAGDDTTLRNILFGGEDEQSKAMALFPDETDDALRSTLDFDAALLRVAADMEKYGEKGAEAGRKIREAVALGQVSSKAEELLQSYKDSATALEKVQDILDKIAQNIKDVNGENLQLKVNVIRDDLGRKNRKTDAEAATQKATILAGEWAYKEQHRTDIDPITGRNADVDKLWEGYKNQALKAVDEWVKAEKDANKAIAQDRIKELGKGFVQSWLKGQNSAYNLDRLDKKSLKQVRDLKSALEGLTDEDVDNLLGEIDERKLEKAGLTIEEVKKNIQAARDYWLELLKETNSEKLAKIVEGLAQSAEKLGDAVTRLGEAFGETTTGNVLTTIGASVSAIGQMASTYGELKKSIASGDKASIITSAITNIASLVGLVGDAIEANKQAQKEWELTVLSTELAYRRLMLDKLDYEESNVFGVESPYKKAADGMEQYRKAADELTETLAQLAEGEVQVGTKKVASGKNIASGVGYGAAAGAAIGTAVGGWAFGLGTVIGTAAGAIVGGLTALFGAKKTVPVYENLLDHYGSLLDKSEDAEPFSLNPKILADYDKLDDKTKEIVDHWDEVQQKMQEAEEALNETISEWAGDLGSQLRDALVEAFRNDDLYSAIDDFHDYVTQVLENLIAQAVFAAVFEDAFKQLQQDLHDSDDIQGAGKGNGKTWQQILADFSNGVEQGAQKVFEGLNYYKSWGEKNGYDLFASSGDDNSLGNGIKSITEDTANLLASYLNAIRADVSYMRMTQTEGWLNVKIIAARMPSPTVWEYIAKIEAHAYDIAISNAAIAQSNAAMLAELRSVITTENGTPAVAAAIQ